MAGTLDDLKRVGEQLRKGAQAAQAGNQLTLAALGKAKASAAILGPPEHESGQAGQ